MTDTKNEIIISKLDPIDHVSFRQEDTETVDGFIIRQLDPGTISLDYADSDRSLSNAVTLEVMASPREENDTLRVVFDWTNFASAPSFNPSPALPQVAITHDTANKKSTLAFPIPTVPHAWFIWDTIGGQIPGFHLTVKVKRKA